MTRDQSKQARRQDNATKDDQPPQHKDGLTEQDLMNQSGTGKAPRGQAKA